MTQPAPDPVVTSGPTFAEVSAAAEQAEGVDAAAQIALVTQSATTAGVVALAKSAHDKSVSAADAVLAQAVSQADAALAQATSDAQAQLAAAQAAADAAKTDFRKKFGALVQAAKMLDPGVIDAPSPEPAMDPTAAAHAPALPAAG